MSLYPSVVAWAAGLFEGEGYIGFVKRGPGHVAVMAVSMTDEDVVRSFHARVGVGRVDGPYIRGGKRKPSWQWHAIGFENAQALVVAFWPWLGQRRRATALEVLREARTQRARSRYRRECPRGHEYTPENTLTIRRRSNDRITRHCRICTSASNAAWQRANRERQTNYRREWRRKRREASVA